VFQRGSQAGEIIMSWQGSQNLHFYSREAKMPKKITKKQLQTEIYQTSIFN
jgi:hypothetical protein